MSTPKKISRTDLIFYAIMIVFVIAYFLAGKYIWPDPEPVDREKQKDALVVATAAGGLAPPEGQPWSALGSLAATEVTIRGKIERPKDQEKPREKPKEKPATAPEKPTDPEKLVTLGAPSWHLLVKIDPRGAGIRQVKLNHFQAANDKTGEPEWEDAARKIVKPLDLVPEAKNRDLGSFLLYHYPDAKGEDYPLDTLGRVVWTRVAQDEVKDNEPVQRAAFQTDVQGVRITKTYTLEARDYHVGLEVKLELVDPKLKEKFFRYQLQGPHGVPIEGQWYTSLLRLALIGRVDDKDTVDRDYQDLREIARKDGGDEVPRADTSIRYAAIVNQFFASGIAVATRDQSDRDFLGQARPLLVESAVKGTLVTAPDDKGDGETEVELHDAAKAKYVFSYARANLRYATEETREQDRDRAAALLVRGAEVIVVHRSVLDRDGRAHEVIVDVLNPEQTAPIFHDDITVAVSTPKDDRGLKLRAGVPVVHKYVLYNGPVKVRLLNHLKLEESVAGVQAGAPAVDPAEVDYYLDDLHLNTLTDYRSPGFINDHIMKYTPWTKVVVFFTNVMHTVLWWLYSAVQYVMPNILVYGVCILLLTVLVRGAMHPVSRKQARTTMKMQALAPELKKLKEKFKDDKQALGMAQMELYRKHGINPMGSCWMMFLQMPVFLGLYYCLQESIHFRLKPFLWIRSLTAPDMVIHWGDKIPWISSWSNYGSFTYLGPYFNLLPVIAVALMIVQQKYTMPPAADEQAAMQQKMMKYMMVFFGLMFYKVAAGLCLYFIASSLWGFAERKLLPKKKPGEPLTPATPARPTLIQRLLQRVMDGQRPQAAANGVPAAMTPSAGAGGKKKRGRPTPADASQDGLLARVRAMWAKLLREAEKK